MLPNLLIDFETRKAYRLRKGQLETTEISSNGLITSHEFKPLVRKNTPEYEALCREYGYHPYILSNAEIRRIKNTLAGT